MSRLLSPVEAAKVKQTIDSYELHESVLKQFLDSNFAAIAGPAGAGKDTLRDTLIQRYPEKYVPILSTTTRPPRAGEKDGITYHFREVEDVLRSLENREFFQAELVHSQQISCLNISEIHKLRDDQFGLSILITAAERKMQAIKQDIKTIFLIPPSLEVLKARMESERMLDQSEIGRRLAAARMEIEYALSSGRYYCLVSDTVDHVVERAHSFLQEGIRNDTDDANARQVIHEMHDRIMV
jgi:guanylate kinase